ncbi:MAG TPA: GNAT family protein [Bacteroidia bacterium]|nr:GNAT family protein [Bacteroidia bacterium]
MSPGNISVRELSNSDIDSIADYWLRSDDTFLLSMGVDLKKIPTRENLSSMLSGQLDQPYELKNSYCLVWELNTIPVGHSNVNKIEFGKSASLHLHLWNVIHRQKKLGSAFLRLSLPYFFSNLKLNLVYSEPYAFNTAPNKTLERIGFTRVRTYTTIPGSVNSEQLVNRWEMTREKYLARVNGAE